MDLDRSLPILDDPANRQRPPVTSDELVDLSNRLTIKADSLNDFVDDLFTDFADGPRYFEDALEKMLYFIKAIDVNREWLARFQAALDDIATDTGKLADRQYRNE